MGTAIIAQMRIPPNIHDEESPIAPRKDNFGSWNFLKIVTGSHLMPPRAKVPAYMKSGRAIYLMGETTILTATAKAFIGAVNCQGTTTCTRKMVMRVVNPGAGSIPPHVPILDKTRHSTHKGIIHHIRLKCRLSSWTTSSIYSYLTLLEKSLADMARPGLVIFSVNHSRNRWTYDLGKGGPSEGFSGLAAAIMKTNSTRRR